MDLGLRQGDVVKLLGSDATSVANWELGRNTPALRFLPAIIQFLGYDPRPDPKTLGERLKWWREGQGWSQEDLAKHLGVDPSSVAGWERDRRAPTGRHRMRLAAVVTLGRARA